MFSKISVTKTCLFTALITLFITGSSRTCAGSIEKNAHEKRAFLKFITGASFSRKADISINPLFWDPALEGYNQDLKTAPIIGAGFGYRFFDFFSGDITVTHRFGYQYRKSQTTPINPSTPQALPSKVRKFDLDSTSVMVDMRLLGRGIKELYYSTDCLGSYIAPVLGGGIGFTYHKIRNFLSQFAPTALTTPLDAISSIGPSSATKTSFTYQLEAGIEYHYQETWGLMVGYRWLDAGKFKTPSSIIGGTGLAGNPITGTAVPPWTGKLRANEIFAEITYRF